MTFNPENATNDMVVIRVTMTIRKTSDGTPFPIFKGVVNKHGRLMRLKFTRNSGFPEKQFMTNEINRFVLINPVFNFDFNNLSPCIWVKGYEDLSEKFNDFEDGDLLKTY